MKAAEEAVANEVLEKLGDMVREREGIERKLSTTYSLGRDMAGSKSKSLLPIYDGGKTRSYSFQGAKKESVTIFHTLSDTSSAESSSDHEEEEGSAAKAKAKAKAKAPIEAETSSNDGKGSPSETTSSSGGYANPLFGKQEPKEVKLQDEGDVEFVQTDSRLRLTRRKTLSLTN